MSSRTSLLACGAVASVVVLADPASAQPWWWPPQNGLTVQPSCIDPSIPAQLTVGGQWPDSCAPNTILVTVGPAPGEIDLFVSREPPPTVCLTVITNWSLGGSPGLLPAGTYRVYATWMQAGQPQSQRTFLDEFTVVGACGGCYPNCDGSTAPGGAPTLNVNDFICFQTKFALGDPYADCDQNGVRNVNDYICFQTKFAIGCR